MSLYSTGAICYKAGVDGMNESLKFPELYALFGVHCEILLGVTATSTSIILSLLPIEVYTHFYMQLSHLLEG